MTALLLLDTEGQRVLAKYYAPPHQAHTGGGVPSELGAGAGGPGMGLSTLKEQRTFEKAVFEKIRRGGGECDPAGRPSGTRLIVSSSSTSLATPLAHLFAAICLPFRSPLSPNYSNVLAALARSGLQAKYTPSRPTSS